MKQDWYKLSMKQDWYKPSPLQVESNPGLGTNGLASEDKSRLISARLRKWVQKDAAIPKRVDKSLAPQGSEWPPGRLPSWVARVRVGRLAECSKNGMKKKTLSTFKEKSNSMACCTQWTQAVKGQVNLQTAFIKDKRTVGRFLLGYESRLAHPF